MTVLERKQEEIKHYSEKNPCMCFNVRKAARAITQIYDNMFRPMGLRATQVSMLYMCRSLGPLTVTQLSQAMATDRTTITRNLKPLEREGLVVIHPGYDKREREIKLTQKGEEVSIKTFEMWQVFQDKIYEQVGKEKLEYLCQELSETVAQIEKI